ncbi:hypothetical protein [Roseateles albus]|uniref:Uncharacterized protein n=1 Tax=Roseateles albus TaxID=2987525 RepID=A0ABT5KD98_9BURK|nr:hypothetical protein [Roseateles albus]MDC8771775.1 hypothetical protein [Roseateles albus]
MKVALLFSLALFATTASAKQGSPVICTYAPSQSKTVAAISGVAGGSSATIGAVSAAAGLTVVTHSSGAAILTGSSGYIAGTIGAAGALPFIVGVGVIVGGAAVTIELVCVNENHPEQVEKIRDASAEFSRRFNEAMSDTKVATGEAVKVVVPATKNLAIEVKKKAKDTWAYAYKKGSAWHKF